MGYFLLFIVHSCDLCVKSFFLLFFGNTVALDLYLFLSAVDYPTLKKDINLDILRKVISKMVKSSVVGY